MTRKGDDIYHVKVEDPPIDVAEVEQRELPPNFPAVSVKIEGPTRVQRLPNRQGPVTADVYAQWAVGQQPDRILFSDPRRARATMIGTTNWFYLDQTTGVKAPIPAGLALVVEHCDAAWAAGNGQASQITCITEYWADPMPN